ncbi:MAG: protein-methionine-sulfoxide reductase catalytic subunit MsrP [Panacagrimonas sp.]
MLIRTPPPHPVLPSQITPERIYQDRRRFIAQLGFTAAALLTGCGNSEDATADVPVNLKADRTGADLQDLDISRRSAQAGDEKVTPYIDATTYNNYYEFGSGKTDPVKYAHTLKTRPWTVEVGGECDAPGQVGIEDLISSKTLEERVYRFRCVEAWSMVVPWVGIPLGDFLKRFKPNSRARYVAFETRYDKEQMPRARFAGFDLPYVEGLRMDEALHPLAMLTVGMYGKVLPNQNGAPLRLVLPWKYGYKSIKSIVRVRFVEKEPPTTWNILAPNEYGFYSNVNPQVSHPRWSQATERRLGDLFKHQTLLYNGYPEVASLYTGMDPVQFH